MGKQPPAQKIAESRVSWNPKLIPAVLCFFCLLPQLPTTATKKSGLYMVKKTTQVRALRAAYSPHHTPWSMDEWYSAMVKHVLTALLTCMKIALRFHKRQVPILRHPSNKE